MRQHEALFANFILKFGDEDLLDYLDEVVLYAFTDDALVRERKGSSFYLIDVEIVDLVPGEGRHAIAGRFIQDTVLRRTQIYKDGEGLIQDERTMQSSPSSFFVLTLEDHRLIYYAETTHAPEISSFKSTMEQFIRRKHRAFIDQVYDAGRESGVRVTKKSLHEVHREPTLQVIPIVSKEGIDAFLRRYSQIKRLDLVVHTPNKEVDGSEVVNNLQALRRQLGADKGRFTVNNSDGLDRQGTKEILEDVSASPNNEANISGLDVEGNKLNGSNEDFSVRSEINLGQLETRNMARRLFKRMQELRQSGALKLADAQQATRRRVQEILAQLQ